ncbi:MAG: hypothetical protein E6G51_09280 [Actinobacteria bacterium]|nr:MAG: hypothetical protein E6G51_09280 [Actinomycetota bacterium]
MSLDLGGPAIEIAIALAFVFFLLSLIASHVTEWFAGLLNLRAKTLRDGLLGMLGDGDVVDRLLKHPLVRTDLQPGRERDPSYIAPENFALALRDLLEPASGEEEVPQLKLEGEARKSVDPKLATQLRALPSGDSIPHVPEIEKWFDESMKRVGGWYKRKSQLVTIAVAVGLVLALNLSTLRIAEQLNGEPKVLANVVAKAEAAAEDDGSADSKGADMKAAGEEAEGAVHDLASLSLPVFWTEEKNRPSSLDEWLLALAGWLITIAAVSLGAPFWFDALGKLSNLRMAGKKPPEEPAKKG